MPNKINGNYIIKEIRSYLIITAGTVLLTLGVYFFKIPYGFVTGGVSGIGTVLGSLPLMLTAAQWISVINAFLLLLGFFIIGKETGIKTFYCSLLFSGLTLLFEGLVPITSPLTDEPVLELIYAILLTSIGSAVIFSQSASSGGTDIIALILKNYTRLDVGKALLITDFLVAASSFITFGVKIGLLSMLGLFAKAFLVDGIIESISNYKYFIVITDKPDEIKSFILVTLHHGVTTTEATGAYSGTKKTMIHTVCHRIDAIKLKKKCSEIDPHAFIVVTTTHEIIGRGFRAV